MTFNELQSKFIAANSHGDICQTWVSLPSLGQLQEQPRKMSFEVDGVATYKAIKFKFSNNGKWILSRASLATLARTLGL